MTIDRAVGAMRKASQERYPDLRPQAVAEVGCRHLFFAVGWRSMLVITRQIKAARSLIGWEQHTLANKAGIAISTVRRLEGLDGPIIAHFETVEKIRAAFELAGIHFIGNPFPGVQIMHLNGTPSL
jgi:DNA-binding XRE family transcriptional regulator